MRRSVLLLMITSATALTLAGCQGSSNGGEEPGGEAPASAPAESTGMGLPAPAAAPAAALAALTDQTVEVGCGLCTYEMAGVGSCTVACLVHGTPMLVTGLELDAHELGLCSAPKEAIVSGAVEGGQLVATKLEVQ